MAKNQLSRPAWYGYIKKDGTVLKRLKMPVIKFQLTKKTYPHGKKCK